MIKQLLKATAQARLGLPALIGGVLFVAFGALGCFLVAHGAAGEPLTASRSLAAVAFGCLYAAPGVLVFASGGRQPLMLAGAVLGFLLIPTSFSITPALIVPSVLVVVGSTRVLPGGAARTLAIIAVVVALGAGAFTILLVGTQTHCWTTTVNGQAVGGGCEDGAVPPSHSAAAMGLTAGAVTVAVILDRRRTRLAAPPPWSPWSPPPGRRTV